MDNDVDSGPDNESTHTQKTKNKQAIRHKKCAQEKKVHNCTLFFLVSMDKHGNGGDEQNKNSCIFFSFCYVCYSSMWIIDCLVKYLWSHCIRYS